mgnify:CR=1 FL=1
MNDYNWCHGPKCHTNHTQDRIRGVQGSKVLRTKKIKVQDLSRWHYSQGWENHFCRLGCLMDFIKEHINEFIRLHPRTEALETPIDVVVETRFDWSDNPYKTKVIKAIDNA